MMKKAISNLLLSVVSVLIMLLLLEGVLRLFFPIYAPQTEKKHENENLMEYDHRYGWFHRRNFATWIELQEYATRVYLNKKGLRGKEYPYKKPPRTRRIIVLGDSYAFGLGVRDPETFSVELERLFKNSKEPVEVINMGVNGFGTAQELLLLEKEGLRYSPDMVVCLFYAGNDMQNNTRGFEYGKSKPYFIIEDNELRLKNYPPPLAVEKLKKAQRPEEPRGRIRIPFKKWFQTYSYAYIFLRLRYNYLLYRLGIRRNITPEDFARDQGVTKALFIRMRDFCKGRGIGFLLVIIPTREQMQGLESEETQNNFVEFAGENSIDCLDLLRSLKGRRDLNFVIDSHWNKKGHKFIAGLLYQRLKGKV